MTEKLKTIIAAGLFITLIAFSFPVNTQDNFNSQGKPHKKEIVQTPEQKKDNKTYLGNYKTTAYDLSYQSCAICIIPYNHFLYPLPEDRHAAYQFKLTSYGYECYKREASAKQKLIDEQARHEAERISDRAHADQDRKLHFKHDWRIAVFNAISGFVLGAVADHFFDIVGNAVRLWSSLLSLFH